mgnify:CR=1 FL=1
MPNVNFIETTPSKNLAEYVEAFWHCRISEEGMLRLLPTASCDLMIHSSKKGVRTVLIGPMTVAQTTQLQPGELFVGARFRPGCRIDLSDTLFTSIKNSKTSDFSSKVMQLGHFKNLSQGDSLEAIYRNLIRLVETLLGEGFITRDSIVDRFLDMAESTQDSHKVANMLNELPISARQFQRRFLRYSCVTPKEFLRLHRQLRATNDMRESGMTITKIASLHGYTDQAHFSHDFHELAGIPPTALEKELTLK